MKTVGIFLIVLSCVAFVACGLFVDTSFDKYEHYYNFSWGSKNAYVGGDAYNYIINGTYFTAFAVYAAACGIAGFIMLVGGILTIALARTNNCRTQENKAEKEEIVNEEKNKEGNVIEKEAYEEQKNEAQEEPQ